MRLNIFYFVTVYLFATQLSFANPYWDPAQIPKDSDYKTLRHEWVDIQQLKTVRSQDAVDVLRIQVDWLEESESYGISALVIEPSGTVNLLSRSVRKPKLGSYLGVLKDKVSGKALYFDAIGTGKEYRKLTRAINLRFPVPSTDLIFELFAENPQTGVMEKVLERLIKINELTRDNRIFNDLELKELSVANKKPALRVNIYAEGYNLSEKNKFWRQAMKAVQSLQSEHFPGVEYMSFYAVFNPSAQKLGEPKDLGLPIPEHDSFLGLYFPYWDNFGRWYHVVYPTRENKFRQGLASAPYDYPIVLVNSASYWGVGNYMSFTAIPAGNATYFTYILLHELGHFFGLNEEYEGGGRTELEFAPDMDEPWSQNITFLKNANYLGLKWSELVNPKINIPTPSNEWESTPPVYGAYQGGYADSISNKGLSHKPGMHCVMESHASFCDICSRGILDMVHFSLGMG